MVVGVVDELERRSLVERRRDPADRRRYLLAVTADGTELLAKAERTAQEATDAFLGPLSGSERRQLGALLLRLMTPKMPWLSSGPSSPS